MQSLAWDETDFLDCLAVQPALDEGSEAHSYEVERDGLRLLITVWDYSSLISISLFRLTSTTPLVDWKLYVRGEVRLNRDKRGKRLVFEDCILTADPWRISIDEVCSRENAPHSVIVSLAVDPDIRIECAGFESRT